MRKLFVSFMAICGFLVASGTASAGLIEHRTYMGDSDGIVFVEDTGFEWLNLSFTDGLSYTSALSTYAADGFFAPDITQLSSMLTALGIASSIDGNCPFLSNQALCTHNNDTANYSDPLRLWFDETIETSDIRAMFSPTLTTVGSGFAPYLWADTDGGGDEDLRILQNRKSVSSTNSNYGTFLVRSASVPTPTTLALFGLGLAGLGLARRKKA